MSDVYSPIRAHLTGRRVMLCFGAGVDSTGMAVALYRAGIRPDVVTFADTGGEKSHTYKHVRAMQRVFDSWGWPEIKVVQYLTKADTGYTTLEGNCLKNETLPPIAFGMHSCSIKWKVDPQNNYIKGVKSGPNQCDAHPMWLETQLAGERIVKLIGYDAGPADTRRSKRLVTDTDFDFFYPLQALGWTRADCVRAIVEDLGLAYVPIKSACFFCPASKQWELFWLAAEEPELLERALLMERNALTGKHSRLKRLMHGPRWEASIAKSDRFPSRKTAVGLGRSFSWSHWALSNGVVDRKFRVIREKHEDFRARARAGMEADNALDMRACG